MRQVLADKKSDPIVYALAGLYTGEDPGGANDRIRQAWARAAGPNGKMTARRAGAESVKWSMRGWLRIYYLFHRNSAVYPGRLEPDVEAKLQEMFFLYGCHKSTVTRANLRNIWFIQGSENHDLMDLANAYLALQAVRGLDAYRDRKLPDGHTPPEHVKAWEAYYARYALERARNGLFVEISPTYGKWFVGEFVNMYEFAESPLVRRRMEMLLHLMWADWSIDQLNGVRGGGKTRAYQGAYSQLGTRDSWDLMGRALTGREGWYWKNYAILSHMALVTSRYTLPDIVLDIALNREGVEPFVFQSVRPAKLGRAPPNPPDEKGYWLDGTGGRMLRYSYGTPECVMGSWMLDPRLEYAAINTQNRWQGVIFSTGPNMRVFPQSVALGNGKTYNQHVAVQHRNVMVVARHPRAKQTGHMRVFFPKAIRKRIVERNGWVVVKEGGAWLGVRVLSGQRHATTKNYRFREGNRNGDWLWPEEEKPPVVFVVSQVSRHRTLEGFLACLGRHEYGFENGCATYAFVDDTGAEIRLDLGGQPGLPRVNGKPVNLRPEKVFDSPFMTSVHGSGIVEIRKGTRRLILDFNQTAKARQPERKAKTGTGSSAGQRPSTFPEGTPRWGACPLFDPGKRTQAPVSRSSRPA